MSTEAHYYRVGLFMLAGLILIGSCTVVLGGGQLFSDPVTFETYFDESVQGLEVGSPVKLRGVKFGSVSEIGFVTEYYKIPDEVRSKYGRLVVVRMELSFEDYPNLQRMQLRERLNRTIRDGLRLKLATQGITGTSFIEWDFVEPGEGDPLDLVWEPEYLYVPSRPSTLRQLSTAAERIFERFEDMEVEQVITHLDAVLVNLNRLVSEMRGTNARVQHMADGGKYDFEAALENLRVTSENLRDLTDTARQYPSLLLLGQPPSKAGQ